MEHSNYTKSKAKELILPLHLEKKTWENKARNVQLVCQHIKYWVKDMFRSLTMQQTWILTINKKQETLQFFLNIEQTTIKLKKNKKIKIKKKIKKKLNVKSVLSYINGECLFLFDTGVHSENRTLSHE